MSVASTSLALRKFTNMTDGVMKRIKSCSGMKFQIVRKSALVAIAMILHHSESRESGVDTAYRDATARDPLVPVSVSAN